MATQTEQYAVREEYAGCFHILDEDGGRVARVSMFLPGPMISVSGQSLYSPTLARAVAEAMTVLANQLGANSNGK